MLSMERALIAAKGILSSIKIAIVETKEAAREEIAKVERSMRADLVVVSRETAVVPYRSKESR